MNQEQTINIASEDSGQVDTGLTSSYTQKQQDLALDLLQKAPSEILGENNEKLFNDIFSQNENWLSAVDLINEYTRSFLVRFWPFNQKIDLSSSKRRDFISTLANSATASSEELTNNLKKIDSRFELPEGYDPQAYAPYAAQLANAYQIISELLLEVTAQEYLTDAMFFAKKSKAEIEEFQGIIEKVSAVLEKQYKVILDSPLGKAKLDTQAIEKSAEWLEKMGRTKISVENLKNPENLGDLAEIYIRLELAAQAAINAKNESDQNKTDVKAILLLKIKELLKPSITI